MWSVNGSSQLLNTHLIKEGRGFFQLILEMQLFLKVNSAFWDAGIFFKAVKEYLEERKIHLKSLIKKQRMGKRLMMKMNKMYL